MKTYTFQVACSFALQYSFPEAEIEQLSNGGAPNFLPTKLALLALQARLEETLGEDHAVSALTVHVEPDDLLGVHADDS
jgi:hypothetical protein